MSNDSAVSPSPSRRLKEAEQAIVRYLQAHPEFFLRHPDLVDSLHIPHPCYPAVSLLEYQRRRLREQNEQLHKKLQELVEVARDNGDLASRLQRLALMLLEAPALPGLLHDIKAVLRDEFRVEFSVLRLSAGAALDEVDRLPADFHRRYEPLLRGGQPYCGRLTREQTDGLFGEAAGTVASAALVPLRGHNWHGLLAVGSRDEHRFYPGMGTLFLGAMGDLISRALQLRLPAVHQPDQEPPLPPPLSETRF